MSSTHLSLNYHIVFGTKDRVPCISPSWRKDLHAYLGGVLKTMDAVPLAINGVADHVHLLIALRSTHCLAGVMRELKSVSSKWVREKHLMPFAWQEGYGAFSVSASLCDTVGAYIEDQEEHHRDRTFAEELVILLEKSGIAYDPRYL